MKIKINLTKEEYDYLTNNLLKNHREVLSQLTFIKDNNSILVNCK